MVLDRLRLARRSVTVVIYSAPANRGTAQSERSRFLNSAEISCSSQPTGSISCFLPTFIIYTSPSRMAFKMTLVFELICNLS